MATCTRLSTPPRTGSSMIMVMVVLLVVGLFLVQSGQLLVVLTRNDARGKLADQSRELVAVGIMRAQQALAREPNYQGESLSVAVWETAGTASQEPVVQTAVVSIERFSSNDEKPVRFRVSVKYPSGQASEFQSTWESE